MTSALIAGIASSAAACTVFSGWSDLQGGGPATREGPDDDASREDARADRGAEAASSIETCDGVTCASGEGCCYSIGALSMSCTSRAACPETTHWFLTCQSRSPCGAARCCLNLLTSIASCEATCGTGSRELCDPSANECDPGKTCAGSSGLSKSRVCQ